MGMRNALTFDLEDYYHVTAFAGTVPPDQWHAQDSRVERNTLSLLDILADAGCQATFFTLGWVAERYPSLIRKIAEAGHEVACHSHRHQFVYQLGPKGFLEDTRVAKSTLEDAGGVAVVGYRAPSFSITRDSLWAFEILAELGFAYDSSVFPVRHPDYGLPHAPRSPYRLNTPAGALLELPLTTIRFAGVHAPVAGGAYFRFLPYWYTKWSARYINDRELAPVCVYLHPWEIDAGQPRMPGSLTARLRHYVGLASTKKKLRRLLADFDFTTAANLLADLAPNQSLSDARSLVPAHP
jgi:polysaccharide deacetylase family protein (PEP-CTERM system associated)